MGKQLLKIHILSIAFLLSHFAYSQRVWEQMDIPYSGNIISLTASPNGTIFAASQTKLYRTLNSGENWFPVDLPGGSFKVAFNQNGDVFVTNYYEIFRSQDNGSTWQVINSDSPAGFTTIAVSLEGVIAAGNINWEFGPFISLSFDNGETWINKDGGGYAEQMKLVFNAQGQLFKGNENVLVRSDDLGTTWSDPLIWSNPGSYMAIVFDSNDEIFIGLDYDRGILHSSDNGDTWERLFNAGAKALAINSNDQLWAGDFDLFKSIDHGNTWSSIPELLNSKVSSICIDNGDNIFVATSIGIFRSNDNGQNWNLSFRGLFEPTVTDIESNNQDVFMVKNGRLFHSSDIGITWEEIILPLKQYVVSSIEVKPNGELYVLGSNTIFYPYGIVMKSADNGLTWTEVVTRSTSDIGFGNNDDIFILSDSLIHRSNDNGINWQILNQDLACLNPSKIAITNTGIIFINSSLCEDQVYVSLDNGNTWTEAGYGGTDAVANLEVDTQGNVYILTVGSELFTSSDNGGSWFQLSFDPVITINTIEIDYQDNLHLGTDNGTYTSYNNGATWLQNSEGLDDSHVTTLHIGILGYAFLGTSDGKLYRQDYNVETTDQLKYNLTLYPNPARDKFSVIYPWFQSGTVEQINIYSIYGKLVKTVPFYNVHMEIDVTDLQAGVYLVSIKNGINKKLIIQ